MNNCLFVTGLLSLENVTPDTFTSVKYPWNFKSKLGVLTEIESPKILKTVYMLVHLLSLDIKML